MKVEQTIQAFQDESQTADVALTGPISGRLGDTRKACVKGIRAATAVFLDDDTTLADTVQATLAAIIFQVAVTGAGAERRARDGSGVTQPAGKAEWYKGSETTSGKAILTLSVPKEGANRHQVAAEGLVYQMLCAMFGVHDTSESKATKASSFAKAYLEAHGNLGKGLGTWNPTIVAKIRSKVSTTGRAIAVIVAAFDEVEGGIEGGSKKVRAQRAGRTSNELQIWSSANGGGDKLATIRLSGACLKLLVPKGDPTAEKLALALVKLAKAKRVTFLASDRDTGTVVSREDAEAEAAAKARKVEATAAK